MADNYKILGQTTAASVESVSGLNQANVVYTVPENAQASISSISLTNTSATAENYYLGAVKAAESSATVVPGRTFPLLAQYNGTTAYSVDGVSWTQASMPSNDQWTTLLYGNGKYISFVNGTNIAAYSTDGITWTQFSMPISRNWSDGIYADNKFVILGTLYNAPTTILYSTDGIAWTQVAAPVEPIDALGSPLSWSRIVYGNGKFVLSGYRGKNLLTSTDGIVWQEKDLSSLVPTGILGLVYGDGKFLLTIRNESKVAYSSDPNLSWTVVNVAYSGISNIDRLAYGNGVFVGTAYLNADAIAYSTDGTTWTQATTPASAYGGLIIYSQLLGKFFVISYNQNNAMSSTDGINWSLFSMPLSTYWDQLVDGKIVLEYSIFNISDAQIIIPNRQIEPNQVDEVVGGITLSAGDQIRVYSESEDLVVQVYGVEIA